MLTVHHLENSRSQRILWLLEELATEYEIKEYERDPKTMLAPKSLRDIHPLGKSPVITHDGNTIAESGAIIEYILDAFDDSSLRPDPGTPEFLRYRYFLHYSEGSAMSPFLLKVVFDQLPKQGPLLMRPLLSAVSKTVNNAYIAGQLRLHLKFIESKLQDHEWFAGPTFTAADIQMSFPLEAAIARLDCSAYPQIRAFIDRIHARPAYQQALTRGGPYTL